MVANVLTRVALPLPVGASVTAPVSALPALLIVTDALPPVVEKADVPVGRVNDYETLFTDEEVVANENFTLYEHPDAGTVRTVNPGARFSETPARMWRTCVSL